MVKQFKCQNCGAPINRARMVCEYCGTQYERKYGDNTVRFVVDRPGVHRIAAAVRVNEEDLRRMPPEATEKYIMDRMRKNIADGLLGYLEMAVEEDPMSFSRIFRGDVRVLDPSWRY